VEIIFLFFGALWAMQVSPPAAVVSPYCTSAVFPVRELEDFLAISKMRNLVFPPLQYAPSPSGTSGSGGVYHFRKKHWIFSQVKTPYFSCTDQHNHGRDTAVLPPLIPRDTLFLTTMTGKFSSTLFPGTGDT
jgi:hypothetical protein